MEPVSVSWLIAASSSPLIAVLSLWTIYVFHTYRRRWRTVDLFLLSIVCQELLFALFVLCYGVVRLVQPSYAAPCALAQWGLVATRTSQVATLASTVADRALTVRWPYRYRFSVRRNQIRYHVAAVALAGALVGGASLFAGREEGGSCGLHPALWDVRFAVFLLCTLVALLLVSGACAAQVEVFRARHGSGATKMAECTSPEPNTGMNSPLDTQSSAGSTRALHRPSRQASRRPYGRGAKGSSDLRWPSVALTSLLCFSLNHIPYLVLMSLATWNPLLWSGWHEAILLWLGLLEGIFVPLLLFCRDNALRNALRRAFQRRSGALSPLVSDDGPFQMYFDKEHFRKRVGTFGPVTPIGIITNYRRAPRPPKQPQQGSRAHKYTLPGLHSGDSVLARSCFGAAFEPLSKLSCADLTSLEMWREEGDEENFYATLSDDFSTFSCKSADDSCLSDDIRMSEELYGGSFTTIANDDFEFHDTRPCGGEVRMKPALAATPPPLPPVHFGGVSRNVSFRDNVQVEEMRVCLPPEKDSELFDFTSSPEDDDEKDSSTFARTTTSESKDRDDTESSSPSDLSSGDPSSNRVGIMAAPHQKSTSFSMNDLDLIHQRGSFKGGIEATFLLPVKSESTMSLYRMNVRQDMDEMVLTPSKSENNVNGDSGFGSGAQSTNPIWSGFLCRKPSDPFWNMRRPTTSAATPTRNYPGILHPRMRKIPWITAWKKLDSGSGESQPKEAEEVFSEKADTSPPKMSLDNHVSTIEEELSDVGTPVSLSGDYNLNVFAKESGVLLENAYGRIERDDCGVKVNFYGENGKFDSKDALYGHKDSPGNVFDTSFESDVPAYDTVPSGDRRAEVRKIENYYEPLNVKKPNFGVAPRDPEVARADRLAVENLTGDDSNDADLYKCELRLNGGHFENLFGTKENIFAQCDDYKGKADVPKARKFERKASGRRDSGRFKNVNDAYCHIEPASIYGQLKRKESFGRSVVDSRAKVFRSTSDGKGRRCEIARRESKTKNDKRPEFLKAKEHFEISNFGEFDNRAERCGDEIEMKDCGRNDLNCNGRAKRAESGSRQFYNNLSRRESQERKAPEKSSEDRKRYCRQNSPVYNEVADRKPRVVRRESQNKRRDDGGGGIPTKDGERQIYVEPTGVLWQTKVERRDSEKCHSVERRASEMGRISAERRNNERRISAERKDSDKRSSPERKEASEQKEGCRRSSADACIQRRNSNNRNVERRESDRAGNPDRRERRNQKVERRDSERLARESSPRVERGDSDRSYFRRGEIRRGNSRNRKKEVKNEGLWANAIPFGVRTKDEEENGNVEKIGRMEPHDLRRSPRKARLLPNGDSRARNGKFGERKTSGSKGRREEVDNDSVWPNKNDNYCDDFIKYRDKCEDNLTHIQNINRETSAERESSRVDQVVRSNSNLLPHQDQKYFNESKPNDINDNCGQKKLSITDFL